MAPRRKRSPEASKTKLRLRDTPDDLKDFVDFDTDADSNFRDPVAQRPRVKTQRQGRAVVTPSTSALCEAETIDSADCIGLDSASEEEWNFDGFFSKAKAVLLKPHSHSVRESPPEVDAASRARLMALLAEAGLRERRVRGDGNCQFRALADQLYGDEKLHLDFRQQAIQQMETSREAYCGFVRGSFDSYLARMRRAGTWGDHVTLQAAADSLGVEVHLLSDYMTDAYIRVVPKEHKSKRILKLCFWSEYHYNSVE